MKIAVQLDNLPRDPPICRPKASSIQFKSELTLFKILPIGVKSKNKFTGALKRELISF